MKSEEINVIKEAGEIKNNKSGNQLLEACMEDNNGWAGRRMALATPENANSGTRMARGYLSDCFLIMKLWFKDKFTKHGYILDYSTKTIYYDNSEALQYLQNEVLPAKGLENFFVHIVKLSFR